MKNVAKISLLALLVGALASCGGGKASEKESTLPSDSSQAVSVTEKESEEIISVPTSTSEEEISVEESSEEVHVHSLEKIEAVEPTCTEGGNIEYWYCEGCDKYFADEHGEEEIDLALTMLAPLGHDLIHHEEVAPTVSAEGIEEYWECSRCHKLFADSKGKTEIEEAGKIEKVEEEIDGKDDNEFYEHVAATYLGDETIYSGGKGYAMKTRLGKRGIYQLVRANLDHVGPSDNNALASYLRLSYRITNSSILNYGVNSCHTFDIPMAETNGWHPLGNLAQYIKTGYYSVSENPSGSKTKYTAAAEYFIPFDLLCQSDRFSAGFETGADGHAAIKKGYHIFFNANSGSYSYGGEFDSHSNTTVGDFIYRCDNKGSWYFWYIQGYGDWAEGQKMFCVDENGIHTYIPVTYDLIAAGEEKAAITFNKEKVSVEENISGTVVSKSEKKVKMVRINEYNIDVDEEGKFEVPVKDLDNLGGYEITVEPILEGETTVDGVQDERYTPANDLFVGGKDISTGGLGGEVSLSLNEDGLYCWFRGNYTSQWTETNRVYLRLALTLNSNPQITNANKVYMDVCLSGKKGFSILSNALSEDTRKWRASEAYYKQIKNADESYTSYAEVYMPLSMMIEDDRLALGLEKVDGKTVIKDGCKLRAAFVAFMPGNTRTFGTGYAGNSQSYWYMSPTAGKSRGDWNDCYPFEVTENGCILE